MKRFGLYVLIGGVCLWACSCFPIMPGVYGDYILTPRSGQQGGADSEEDQYSWRSDDRLYPYNETDDTAINFYIQESSGNMYMGGDGRADAVALLELNSTTKGFLPPVMTETQRDALSNVPTGLIIFNTTNCDLEIWDGGQWRGAFRNDDVDGGT